MNSLTKDSSNSDLKFWDKINEHLVHVLIDIRVSHNLYHLNNHS